MTREPPYTLDILRLAASLPLEGALAQVDGSAEVRSATCGSTLRSSVRLEEGRVAAIGQKVIACAYGQASAALVQQWAPGRLKAEVSVMRASLKAWLEGRGDLPEPFRLLHPVQGRSARHGAVLLPLDGLIAALNKVQQ